MKAIGHILLAVMLGLGVLARAEEAEKSPAILLQEAIYQEETEGNLDKAIELYGQVLEQAADIERLAARATYQLGLCHLKKGDQTAAADYFRKTISTYPKQAAIVKKANEQLEKIAPTDSEGVLFTQLPQDVLLAIGNMYGQTCSKAGLKNLYTNSNIRYVDSEFKVYDGGYGYYTNHFDTPLTQKVRLSGTSYPNQSHYDIAGRKMNTEIVPDETRKNFYHIYWTPEEPLPPGQFYMYGWCLHGAKKSALVPDISNKDGNEKYASTMQNHFGSHAFEVFFLVIPNTLQIAEAAEPYTDTQTAGDYTIYAWEKEVQPDENHLVTVYLAKNGTVDNGEKTSKKLIELALDDGKQTGKWSYSGGGHAVKFKAPQDNCVLKAIRIYGSRYGEYEVPKENFHVWLCDTDFSIIKEFAFPYSIFQQRGLAKWANLKTDPTELPAEFILCVSFDPHRTKGIYLHHDAEASGNSFTGLPGSELKPFEDGDWLFRAVIAETPGSAKPNKLQAEDQIAEGWKLWRERKLAEAEDKFSQAVRSDPDNDGAYQGLGWAQLNQGKKQNAEASFKKCVKLNPQNSAALNGLGWIEHGKDNIDMAIKWWEKAVEASNGTATASLSGLTKVYMDKQEYDKAVKYYEMWLKAEPDNQEAKDGLEKAKQAKN